MNMTLGFTWNSYIRMIEGGNSKYHDSLEELFINTADSKVIR